ncbi:hypothetical protein ACFWFQ_35585, partial [Nocardia salmonicida]|uniref:hypothetical protein n=1 Tax=Nocardia salmonicida TaxID=53431 RepID=UPI00365D0407
DMAAQYATIEGFKSPIADIAAQFGASGLFQNSVEDAFKWAARDPETETAESAEDSEPVETPEPDED